MLAFFVMLLCISGAFLSVSMLIHSIVRAEPPGIALWSFICGLFVTATFC